MRVRVIDLDGSIPAQERVLRLFQPEVYDVRAWGPRVRLGCRWTPFYRLERRLDRLFGHAPPREPWITMLGSSDFHHLTLTLLRRLHRPFNLLVLDKRPDWLTGSPFLHCDSWLYHAARLPNVRRIFHVGGETDFDNHRRLRAPTAMLTSGKIVPLPATRPFRTGFWRNVPHRTLRSAPQNLVDRDRLEDLLWPYLEELDRVPLYVSLDKGVLWMPESITNWDAGVLDLNEVQEVLQFFMKASGNDLLGMDIVGDWSDVETDGLLRYFLHRVQHPRGSIDAEQARLCNERTNSMLLRFMKHDPATERITCRSRQRSA